MRAKEETTKVPEHNESEAVLGSVNDVKVLESVSNTDIKNGHYDIPFGVTSIGNVVFANCTGLTGVTIPPSVMSIGDSAFANCTGLAGVSIPPSVTSISNYAFFGCTGLTSVTIPLSVTSIGNYAFFGCTGLTSVTIPPSVTSIRNKAFLCCTGLTSVTIPPSVASIGTDAFLGCTGLTAIIITASNKEEYQRILKMLPAELRKIAIETESLREKTFLTVKASRSPGFFGNVDGQPMPSEMTGTIIAKLAQLHGQPQADEPSATNLAKS